MRNVTEAHMPSRRAVISGGAAIASLAIAAKSVPASAQQGMLLQRVPGTPLAPEFELPDLDGKSVRFSDLKGKVVLVNFWATWCPPCVTEVPDLVRLQTKYEGRLVVVGVADDHGAVDVVQNFASAKHVHYPLVMNTPALAASFPGLIGLPTTYVIDQGGRIVKKHIGQLRIDRVEAEVDALLAGRVEPR